jgi:FKBP-type peptidyl-prolyl cis-trans isomerases 1
MKRVSILIGFVAMLVLGSCTSFSKKAELKTNIDSMSYYYGLSRSEGVMDYLIMNGVDTTHMDAFFEGFSDGAKKYGPKDIAYIEGMRVAHVINSQWVDNINGDVFMNDPKMTANRLLVLSGFYHGIKNPKEFDIMLVQTYSQMKMEEVRNEYKMKKFAKELADGEKFLAENKNKEGIITTPSGLQYKILNEGKGEIPTETSIVKVNYRGTLIDGTEFDSSFNNNAPSSLRVTQVIAGWTEALKMMPEGSKWRLFIPNELGYGSELQSSIPPFSALIFELELLEIESE